MRARNGKQRAKEHEWATAHQSPVKMIFFLWDEKVGVGMGGGNMGTCGPKIYSL